jgi:hypothetical protein
MRRSSEVVAIGMLAALCPLLVSRVGLAQEAEGPAPEEAAPEPLIEAATAQARAEVAVRALAPVMNDRTSGWDGARKSVEMAYREAREMLERELRREERMPEEERQEWFIEKCRTAIDGIEKKWRAQEIERSEAAERRGQAREAHRSLHEAFRSMGSALERAKDAGADAAAFVPAFGALESRAAELRREAQTAIGSTRAEVDDWRGELEKAKTLVGKE